MLNVISIQLVINLRRINCNPAARSISALSTKAAGTIVLEGAARSRPMKNTEVPLSH